MFVRQFVHQLNNTELGRTGTHDCYAYISKETAPFLSFLCEGSRYEFAYKRDSSIMGELFYTHTSTGEYRISGCKKFFEAGCVNAGDCIVLERVGDKFWVDFIKRNDVVVFNKLKDQWQCRNEDRLARYLDKKVSAFKGEKMGNLEVKSLGPIMKRTQKVNAYALLFDGHPISKGDIYNLLVVGGVTCLTEGFKDKISTVEWSDHE